MDPLLTVEDVAKLIGVSSKSCYDKYQKGFLPCPIRIGRLLRWRREDIEKWLLEKKETA